MYASMTSTARNSCRDGSFGETCRTKDFVPAAFVVGPELVDRRQTDGARRADRRCPRQRLAPTECVLAGAQCLDTKEASDEPEGLTLFSIGVVDRSRAAQRDSERGDPRAGILDSGPHEG